MATFDPLDPLATASFDATRVASPFDDNDPTAAPDSLYSSYAGSKAKTDVQPVQQNQFRVNFADPYQQPLVSVGHSSDPWTLDSDPFGTKAVDYGRRVGKPYTNEDVLSLNVFGREMGFDQLVKTEAGRRLIEIAHNNRVGHKRGLLEALTDFSVSDLPFMSLVGTVGGSISDAVTVSDVLKKIQNGEKVTDEEAIKARLYAAESEYRSTGGVGSMIGDIVRAAPGFMFEFFAAGGIYSGIRAGLVSGAKESADWMARIGLSRMTKMATDGYAEHFAGNLIRTKVGSTAADAVMNGWKSLGTQAGRGLYDDILNGITSKITATVAGDLGVEATSEIAKATAKRRATVALERQILKNTSDTAVKKWWVGTQRSIADHASRALLDFGKYGTELSTLSEKGLGSAWSYLGDAVNMFLVEAPIRGALIMAPQQFIANPVIGQALGKDGRTVSEAELSLQMAALRTGNKQLMSSAHAIAFGMSFLEYASESSGRGFDSLFKAAGTKLVAAKKLGRTAIDGVLDASEGIISRDSMRDAGGWFRNTLHKAFGTGSDMAKGIEANKEAALRAMFRNAEEAAAKTGRTFTHVEEDALQRFIVSGGQDLAALGSREAAELVTSKGGFDRFLRESIEEAITHQEDGITFKWFAQFVVVDKMHRLGLTPDKTVDWLRSAGYDGLVQEMLEERYSDFAKGLFGWDERTADEKGAIKNVAQAFKNLWPGWDQLVAEAVGFSIPMGVRIAVNHIQRSAGGSRLTKLQYWADKLRNLHAGTFVETKTGQWFKEADERIAELRTRVDNETDEGKKAKLRNALSAAESQRRRVSESIGGAAQEMSDRVRFLEAPNTQVENAADERKHETQTAQTSARAAAVFEFLTKEAGSIGRTLDDMQTVGPGEHVPFWNRIAARVAGITGAIVTGDLSLAQMNPASWSMVDRGFDEGFVDSLVKLSRQHDNRAFETLVREKGAVLDTFERDRKKLSDDEAALVEQVNNLKPDDTEGRTSLAERITGIQSRREELERKISDARETQRQNLGVSREDIRKRSETDYQKAARMFMASWLAADNIKFFQQSEMRDIAVAHLARQYGFTEGQEKTVNGTTVATMDEFARAVAGEVQSVQDRIAELTLKIVHNRDFAENNEKSPYEFGQTLVNIPVDSPLFKDALLGAALEQSAFAESFEVDELDDSTALSSVMSRKSVPLRDVQSVAELYEPVTSGAEITQEQKAALDRLARTWGFGLSEFTPEAISAQYSKVVDLARKVVMLQDTSSLVWVRERTESNAYSDPAEQGKALEAVRVRAVEGGFEWVVPEADAPGKTEDQRRHSGPESKMQQELSDLGYRDATGEQTISFGHARRFSSRSAALLIEKFGYVSDVLLTMGKAGTETDVDPRFRTKTENGKPVRKYDARTADGIRVSEVTQANRWVRNARPAGKELDAGVIRENYTASGIPEADVERVMGNDKKMYETVYRRADGSDGYIVAQNKFLASRNFTVPSIAECQEKGGVLENPNSSVTAAYLGMPSLVTPVGGLNTYVFLDFKNNPHISYDAGLVHHVLRKAVFAHQRVLFGRHGGVTKDSSGAYGTVAHKFFKRARLVADALINESRDSGRDSEADSMQALYDQLFKGVSDQTVAVNAFVMLVENVCVGQLERDAANGRARLGKTAPWRRLVNAMRRAPEYIPMVALTDVVLGGSGFSVDKAKDAPATGLQRLVRIMSGRSEYSFLRDLCPPGMQPSQFRNALRDGMQKALAEGKEAPALPENDSEMLTFVRGLAEQAGCKDAEEFQDFIETVLRHAGLNAGTTDLASWDATLAERRTAERSRARAVVALRAELDKARKELEALKEKLAAAVEKEPDADHSGLAQQVTDAEEDVETKAKSVQEAEGIKEGKDVPETPKAAATKPAPAPAKRTADPTADDFEDEALPGETSGADPEGFRRRVWKMELSIDDTLSDLSSEKNNDEVGAAVAGILPVATLLAGGMPDRSTVASTVRRFFRVRSDADVETIADRAEEIFASYSSSTDKKNHLTFEDTMNALSALGAQDGELVAALHDYLSKDNDEGVATKDNEKFGDKALSVFQALSPFARVLAAVKPECGKNLQGFLSTMRGEVVRMMDDVEKMVYDETLDKEDRRRLATRYSWLDNARSLISQRTSDLGGDTYAQRAALHIATVNAFTSGTPEADDALAGLIRAMSEDDGTGHPVCPELAVFFGYVASLPVGVRAGVLTIASGMMPADTVRVTFTEAEYGEPDSEGQAELVTPAEYSIEPSHQSAGRLMNEVFSSAFSEAVRSGDVESVKDAADRLVSAFAALSSKKSGNTGKTGSFLEAPKAYDITKDNLTVSRAKVYRQFEVFKNNADLMATALDEVLGSGNALSAVLRSTDLRRKYESEIAYAGAARLTTIANTLSSFSRSPYKDNRLPFACRSLSSLLTTYYAAVKSDGLASGEDLFRRLAMASANNGDLNATDATMQVATSTATDQWITILNDFSSSLPRTTVRSDIVEGRTLSGARASIAASLRGAIPIVERWMTVDQELLAELRKEAEDRKAEDADAYVESEFAKRGGDYSFRNLAMNNLRAELVAEANRKNVENVDEYVAQEIEKLGGTEAIIDEAQRTLRWPGRRNLPIIARNTAIDYRNDEVIRACREHFAKRAAKENRWFVQLYAGDHSSSNLIQIPFLPLSVTNDKRTKTTASYDDVARAVNDATGVTLMGNSAKRSAVSSADAEQIPMAGCTVELAKDPFGVPRPANPSFGENRIGIAVNIGVDHTYDYVNDKGDTVTGEIRYTNEEMKGTMVASGFGPFMFQNIAKNPEFLLEKLHFIAHGRELAFQKSATSVVRPGKNKLTGTAWALGNHALGFYSADELRRSSITISDYDSYKLGVAMSMAKQQVGVLMSNGKCMDLIEYVITTLQKKGLLDDLKSDLDAKAIDEAVGEFTWKDALRGDEKGGMTASKVLGEGVLVRRVDNVHGNMVTFSYVDNTVMAIKAANISHGSKPEMKHNNKNYTTDSTTKAVGQALDVAADTVSGASDGVQRDVVDVLTGYATVAAAIATHTESVNLDLQNDARLQRERKAGTDTGCIAYVDKKGDVEASRIRKSLLCPVRKVDAGLITTGAFTPVTGKDGKLHFADHTDSDMRRACHRGSMVLADTQDEEFFGARLNPRLRKTLRRLGMCEVNVKHSEFRYTWFLNDVAGLSTLYDELAAVDGQNMYVVDEQSARGDADRVALLKLEAVFSILRDQEARMDEDGKANAVAIRDRLGNLFVDHHQQPVGQRARKMCFEDLFTSADGSSENRTFDRTAVLVGKDRLPITTYEGTDGGKFVKKNTEPMIALGGSTTFDPRTPSYDGGNWLQTCRASFPCSEDAVENADGTVTYTVGKDAYLGLDAQSLDILGNDNDGDEGIVCCFGANKTGVAPWVSGKTVASVADLFTVDGDRDAALDRLRRMMLDGTETEDTDEGPAKGEWVYFSEDEENGTRGYQVTGLAKRAVANAYLRCIFDMARQIAVPKGTEERPFVGRLSDETDANGNRVFNGNETAPCKAWFLDDKELWDWCVAAECPPDEMKEEGASMGDINRQQRIQQSAKDTSEARASMVSTAEHLHVAFFSGLFEPLTVADKNGNEFKNPYTLFNREVSHSQFVAFARHWAGGSNMSFDDMKERICGRVGISNRLMIDVLAADILSAPVLPANDEMYVHPVDVPNADGNGTHVEYRGLLADYIRSVRPKAPVYGKDGVQWKDRLNRSGKTENDRMNSLVGTTLSVNDDASRLFMNLASNQHLEDRDFRRVLSKRLFDNVSGSAARQLRLERALGITAAQGDRGEWKIEIDSRVAKPGTAKYVVAEALKSMFSRKHAPVGTSFGEFMGRVCRGSVQNGFSVEAGYLFWLVSAANGKIANVSMNRSSHNVTDLQQQTDIHTAVRKFFRYMNVSGVLQKVHDFAGSVQFMQADPGAPDAPVEIAKADAAYQKIFGLVGPKLSALRRETLEKMHRATMLAYSSEALRSGSSEARAVRARSVLSDNSSASAEEVLERSDSNRVNGTLADAARNEGNTALADMMAELNEQLERLGHDEQLVGANIRQLGDAERHFVYIPAAAQVISTAGGSYVNGVSDVFRLSECLSRGSVAHGGKLMPAEHPLDVLHFRRGAEALFEVVFSLAATSEEGQRNSALNYLYSVNERSGRSGYAGALNPYRRYKHDPLAGDNSLRTIRNLFSVGTPGALRNMEAAFLALGTGELDNCVHTFSTKGFGNVADVKNWRPSEKRRGKTTHEISVANLLAFEEEYKKNLVGGGKRLPAKLSESIAVTREVIRAIAAWRNIAETDVVIHPSDLVKTILPWYTVVMDPIDGAPSYDAFSGSMVNCFPGFWKALSGQQAANDRTFDAFRKRAEATVGSEGTVVPYVDLVAMVNNAPVNRKRSRELTRENMKAAKAAFLEAGDAESAKRIGTSIMAAEEEVDRKLNGLPSQYAVVVRSNPRSRNLFDIFRDSFAERVTYIYDGMAGMGVEAAGDGLVRERDRQRIAAQAAIDAGRAKREALAQSNVPTSFNDREAAHASLPEVGAWTIETLAKARPEIGSGDAWAAFEKAYPGYRDVVAKWRAAGVAESVCQNRAYIMYRFAQQENILVGSEEPYGIVGDADSRATNFNPTRKPADGLQRKGDGNLRSLFAEHDAVIVFDTETYGTVGPNGHVVEISAVKYEQSADGTLKETGRMNRLVKLPAGLSMSDVTGTDRDTGADRTAESFNNISDEMLAKDGVSAADAVAEFDAFAGGRPLLVAHKAAFDAGMMTATFSREGRGSVLDRCDWLDTLTVFRDRASQTDRNGKWAGHTLARAITHYGLDGKVANTHRAGDDVAALCEVLKAMDSERDDLDRYVNLFGFYPRHGIVTAKNAASNPAAITFVPQSNGPSMADVTSTAYAGRTVTEDLTPPTDRGPKKDHREEPSKSRTRKFATHLENALKAFEAKGANTTVRVEGNTIVVERDVVGDKFAAKAGHSVRTVVRMELGDWAPSSRTDSDGNPVMIDLNNPATLRSLLAVMQRREPAFRRLTVDRLMAVPYDVRLALADRFAPTALRKGGSGSTGHTPSWCVDANGLRTLCSGVRINAGQEDAEIQKAMYHEYFHASMSMLIAMGAVSEADCEKLGRTFRTKREKTNDPRSWFDEESLAYAFGEFASRSGDNAKSVKANAKSTQSIFQKILGVLQGILDAITGIVLPNGFSYDETSIDVTVDGTDHSISARDILFNMVLSGAVVESRETSASATVERLDESNRVAKESLEESAMASVRQLGATNLEDPFPRALAAIGENGKSNAPETTKSFTHRGVTVEFNEDGHLYWTKSGNGRVDYTSGTSFISMFAEPFDADKAIRGMNPRTRAEKYPHMTDAQIKQLWKDNGTYASELGTRVHSVYEAAFAGRENEDEPMTDEERKMLPVAKDIAEQIKSGKSGLGEVEIVGAEAIVFDPTVRIAGTIDLVARAADGTVILVDHKTNRDLYKRNGGFHGPASGIDATAFGDYELQLNLYRRLAVRNGFFGLSEDTPVKMFVNYLDHEGRQKFVPVSDRTDVVDEMVRYAHGHLARFSQLPEIARDQMARRRDIVARIADPHADCNDIVDAIVSQTNAIGYNETVEERQGVDPNWTIRFGEDEALPTPTLSPSQEITAELADEALPEGFGTGSGVNADSPRTVVQHNRMSRALVQIIRDGIDSLDAETIQMIKTAEKAALFNGTVRGVVNRALRQLASLTGSELPKSGEARNLMFSAVKAVYRNFSDYEFNRRTNGHVNLADGGKREVQKMRQHLSDIGLTAGVLIQSGVTHEDIAADGLSRLHDMYVAEKQAGHGRTARAISHFMAQITRLANNANYARFVFDEIESGFRSSRDGFVKGTGERHDFEPVTVKDPKALDGLQGAAYKVAVRNIQNYPWRGNPAFQEAMKTATRTCYMIVASRNYAKLQGDAIVGTNGRDITASLGRTVELARRTFSPLPNEVKGLPDVNWKVRAEIGKPLTEKETAALVGLRAEDLANHLMTADPSATVDVMMTEPEGWMLSTIRPRFHGKSLREMCQDEHNGMQGVLSKLRDRANWWTRYLGMDVPAGHSILNAIEEDISVEFENGHVVYKENTGKKRIAFHARQRRLFGKARGNLSDVTLDNLDHEELDWNLKAVDAKMAGQRYLYTSIGDLAFEAKDLLDENGDARVYTSDYFKPENVRARFAGATAGNMISNLDMTLYRMVGATDDSSQLPARILYGNAADGSGFGFYRRFTESLASALNATAVEFKGVNDARAVIRAWNEGSAEVDTVPEDVMERVLSVDEGADFNVSDRVLTLLERDGVVVAHRETQSVRVEGGETRDLPVARRGAVVMPVSDLERYWDGCTVYRKLRSAGRDANLLTYDAIGGGAMKSYREAMEYARKNRWMFDGDGSLLNGFGSHVPFLAGSGAYKWMCERVGRDRKEITERLTDAEKSFAEMLDRDAGPVTQGQWRMLFSYFDVAEKDASEFKRAVWSGEYGAGSRKSVASGLVLSRDDLAGGSRRVAAIIYARVHDLGFKQKSADERFVKAAGGRRAIANMIDMYDQAAAKSSVLVGSGLNADQMFREHGVLPANTQVFHHVMTCVGNLAKTIQFRNTLVGFVTAKDVNGRPISYIRPSLTGDASNADGIPEALWKELALWWVEANPELRLSYDDSVSGRENAAHLYDAIMKSNGGKVGGRKFSNLDESYLRGVKSIAQFACLNDTDDSDHSSVRNRLNGGEAMGYAKQLFSIPRVIGGDFRSKLLNRVSSWSKTLSVQCSLFFPIATRIESTTAAVGFWTMVCSNTNPRMAEMFGNAMKAFDEKFGTDVGACMNRNFVGLMDIVDMMDSDDPFLEDLKDVCAALGIPLSDRLVNPAEGDKSFVQADVRRIVRAARRMLGDSVADNIRDAMEGFLFRGSERAFTYVLNATKMALALQIAQKLESAARRQGRHFDLEKDVKPLAPYINAEAGGIDPLQYPWANPRFLELMGNTMFSWEWTKGAWAAGGGEILEDALFGGHMTNPQMRRQMLGRWLRMYGEIMIGIPAAGQVICKALGKLLGWDDDQDKWFTWNNEEKIGMSAFDLSPLLKGLSRGKYGWINDSVNDLKELPILGRLIPGYTGKDDYNTSGGRRYYMHFGKQGWEFFRWFNQPFEQAMSKLSMPTQRLIEGLAGYNPSNREYNLPFSNMTLMERWLNPTTDGALFGLAKAFVPFSANALASYGDAGLLPIFGPVKMGASRRKTINDLKAVLSAWASNDRTGGGYSFGTRRKDGWMSNYDRVSEILRDAKLNGIDPAEAFKEAVGQVQSRYYRTIYAELPKALDDNFDEAELRKAARALNRLGTKLENAYKSLQTNAKHAGLDWKKMPRELRLLMREALRGAIVNPFGNPNKIASPGVDDDDRRAAGLMDY